MPAVSPGRVDLDRPDGGATQLLAAEDDDPAVGQPRRGDSAARGWDLAHPLPAAAAGVVAIDRPQVVRVAAGDHVEAPAGGGAGGVVAPRAGEAAAPPPAPAREVVDLERPQRAVGVGAARGVE